VFSLPQNCEAEPMDTRLQTGEEDPDATRIVRQAVSYTGNAAIALIAWAELMTIGYIVNPVGIPQNAILGLSIAAPCAMGFIVNRFRQDKLAPEVWLLGLIWILIIALWILDMPTGTNECFKCGAIEKLTRTLFSLPGPSGLIDNDGPFLGTWPAAALIGYGIGARLALRQSR
jgi:hypothetical protein